MIMKVHKLLTLLWNGGDINRKGKCLAAWEAACKNKKDGGLGIIDINKQNKALLLKFLDKFYNHVDTPWVRLTWDKLYLSHNTPPHARHPSGSFWWKDILKQSSLYRSMTVCCPGNGHSILFWADLWVANCLKESLPRLYSFAKRKKCSISQFMQNDTNSNFFLPLSPEAAQELQTQNFLSSFDWNTERSDIWAYRWNPSTSFFSKKAYHLLLGDHQASPLFEWMWKGNNLGKHKFFF